MTITSLPLRSSVLARNDLRGAALNALGVRIGALEASSDKLIWRTDAFAEALPALSDGGGGDDVVGLRDLLAQALAGRAAVVGVVSSRQGRRVFDARVAPSADGALLFVELDDAAERQAAQRRHLEDRERLLLTSRVLSVGEMASMIAHELNQPLGSIVNVLRGVKARLNRGALTAASGAAALDQATEQALYASGVIARIRSFVDQRQPQVELLDLVRLARSTLELLDWEISRDQVRTQVKLAQFLPPVQGDAVMIQQVLVNLARNALEAMRPQGCDRRVLTLSAAPRGDDEVELRIIDTGPGISEDAAARMFEPFYSTKAEGMGIGLGVCRSIIELHGGRMWFTRNVTAGSTLHVALPVAKRVSR